jgi:hypothetical protein
LFVAKFRQEDRVLSIHLRRWLHSVLNRGFNLDVNPDLNLELNRALFARFNPPLPKKLFASLFGQIHANK